MELALLHVLARVGRDSAVDVRNLGVELVELLLRGRDVGRGPRRVDGGNTGCDGLDGVLKLLHAVALIGQQCNAQRTNAFRQLLLKYRQGRLTLCRHQHALALSQVVADDVGNGVGLARPGWPLHDHAIVGMQFLDDGDLLVVVGHGEEQLHGVGPTIAGRQASERLLGPDANCRVTVLDEAADDARQRGRFLDLLLKAPDVLQEDVAGTFAPKEHPGVRNLQLVARHRRSHVVGTHLIGTRRVKVPDGGFQRAVKGRRLERVDPVCAGGQCAAPERLQLTHAGQFHLGVAVRLQPRLDITRPNLEVERLLVERDFAGLHQQRVLDRCGEAFLLPRSVADAPSQLERGISPL